MRNLLSSGAAGLQLRGPNASDRLMTSEELKAFCLALSKPQAQ
jgi:hypothetical protein